MMFSIYCCVTNDYKGAYIIVKLPDGNVVKGYGKYKDIYILIKAMSLLMVLGIEHRIRTW